MADKLIKKACKDGNIKFVEKWLNIFGNRGIIIFNILYDCFEEACKGGHIDIIQLIFNKISKVDWNFGLLEACINCRIDAVKFILKYAKDFNLGLAGACEGGNMDIVQLMIKKKHVIGMRVCMERVLEVI